MSNTPSEAEKQFRPRGKTWCDTVVFDVSTTINIMDECEQKRIPILGVEGFTLGTKDSKEVIYTSTFDILDLSDAGFEAYERTRGFVSNPRRDHMYFDIVFGD
jgi:hypothetical protein